MGLFNKNKDKDKEKTPFKETGIGKFLTEKAPDFLGGAVEFIGDVTGVGMLENIGQKIQESNDLTEDQKAEAAELLAHEIEMFKLESADRDSARKMQMAALDQDDRFSKRFVYYLAIFIIVSATAFGIMLFFIDVPEANKRLVEMFADIYLFAGAVMVIQFFFGSSKSSKDKTEIMKDSMEE
jgi:hypothetical protein